MTTIFLPTFPSLKSHLLGRLCLHSGSNDYITRIHRIYIKQKHGDIETPGINKALPRPNQKLLSFYCHLRTTFTLLCSSLSKHSLSRTFQPHTNQPATPHISLTSAYIFTVRLSRPKDSSIGSANGSGKHHTQRKKVCCLIGITLVKGNEKRAIKGNEVVRGR